MASSRFSTSSGHVGCVLLMSPPVRGWSVVANDAIAHPLEADALEEYARRGESERDEARFDVSVARRAPLAEKGNSAEAARELSRASAEELHVVELDALVASDHVGKLGQRHRSIVTLRRERGEGPLDERAVFPDERALLAAHLRVAEDVEGSAPEALERGEQGEDWREPRAQPDLLLETERAEEWGMQVPVVAGGRPEAALQLRGQGRAQVEPRHLVLVLVGHQLEEIARHGFRETGAPRRLLSLFRCHPGHEFRVLAGVGGVLIRDQLGDSDLEQPAQLSLGARGVHQRL